MKVKMMVVGPKASECAISLVDRVTKIGPTVWLANARTFFEFEHLYRDHDTPMEVVEDKEEE